MRRQYTWDDFVYFLRRGSSPATKFIITANVALSILGLIFASVIGLRSVLAFSVLNWVIQPWTLVTYPLASPLMYPGDLINLFFAALWLWFIGGSLERGWGTRVYTFFFFIISAISALSLSAGALLLPTSLGPAEVGLFGLWMPLAPITVAWAAINPDQQILLYFIIPIRAKWVAWLTVGVTFLVFAQRSLLLGVFALGGCAAAWLYVGYRERTPGHSTPVIRLRQSRTRWFSPASWIRGYRERKRLRKLFGEDRDDRRRWR